MKNPSIKIPNWPSESGPDRAESCIVFLAIHGLLSDGEKRKVRARLQASVDKWNAAIDRAAAPAPHGGER